MTRGRGGVRIPPKNDDVIYEQPPTLLQCLPSEIRGSTPSPSFYLQLLLAVYCCFLLTPLTAELQNTHFDWLTFISEIYLWNDWHQYDSVSLNPYKGNVSVNCQLISFRAIAMLYVDKNAI